MIDRLLFLFNNQLLSNEKKTILLPGAKWVDGHHGLVHYEIPPNDLNLSGIFGLMEAAKQQFSLEDYVVGQTTMEQVFHY